MGNEEINFTHLVEETYALREQVEAVRYPNTPGVFYRICRGGGYFYEIQVSPWENIRDEGLKRLKGKSGGADSSFFATPTLELAHTLASSVEGRRFPLEESTFCNIGDPSENWWMLKGESSFKILLRSYGLQISERTHGQVCLGPLGDSKVASIRFGRLERYGGGVSFHISKKMIEVRALPGGEREWEEMCAFFEEGQVPEGLFEMLRKDTFPTSLCYLRNC